jgi:hypothetical protein
MSPLNGVANGHAVNGAHAVELELDRQRARLEAEIVAAKTRAAAARQRAVERDTEVRAALKVEVEAAQARLADMERQHQVAVGMLRDAARGEVERILAEAREHIAAFRGEVPDVG